MTINYQIKSNQGLPPNIDIPDQGYREAKKVENHCVRALSGRYQITVNTGGARYMRSYDYDLATHH